MTHNMYFKSKVEILLLLMILCSKTIKSDLPVHCKREQIEGEWIFRINSDIFNPDLNEYKTSCGHGFPDNIEKMVGDINYSFESYRDISLILARDYKIYEPNSSKLVGNWTPVYDEGFIVNYKYSIFTAYMKYFLKEKTTSDNPSSNLYSSNCDKTMIGWVIHNKSENDKNWSCFFGFKIGIKNEFSSYNKNFLKPNQKFNKFEYVKNHNNPNGKNDAYSMHNFQEGNFNGNFEANYFNQDESTNPENENIQEGPEQESFLEIKMKNKSELKMKLWMSKYEEQKEIVNEINNNNLSWKAHINDEFIGLSFLQLKHKMGMKKSKSSNIEYLNNYLFAKNNKKSVKSEFDSDNIENDINEDINVNSFKKNSEQKQQFINPGSNDGLDFETFYNVTFNEINMQKIQNNLKGNDKIIDWKIYHFILKF